MYRVVMVPNQKFRPVLVLAVETWASAVKLRQVLIEWNYLEFSTLRVCSPGDAIEVDAYWFWPWRKVVTAYMVLEDE